MGACFEHPSPVSVKHRIRSYLLGKDTALMGDKYNSEKECNTRILSEGSMNNKENIISDETKEKDSLDRELFISAMAFCSSEGDSSDISDNDQDDSVESVENISLEEAMAMEGLRYFGGFIAKKFPQYQFLRKETEEEQEKTWIEDVARMQGKLIHPSLHFLAMLEKMERLFKCYHGEKGLKAGKGSINNLSNDIANFVDLPKDVIIYFVRCPVFFRMRILNREIESSRKKTKKLSKILK